MVVASVLCSNSLQPDFVHVDAEVSLLHAASLFQNRHIKFLPVVVPGSATVLALISHVEILEVSKQFIDTFPLGVISLVDCLFHMYIVYSESIYFFHT